ncbi:serine/threonine-protein phosphatase [Streptomyces sp. NBC_00121]|uniref:PP2C family protein-serine/threonine phosphatase n=1 Tax=unclassified Streptomyces TaxID=2593676 RepID=UPI002DD8A7BF|nr:PP2C family protein-serine/threonine phosphatase [Streptomyces sp. NBC_01760]WSC73146.1 serine/threonine-protein phosphatase [Streptomyces sp. NBC_01760]WTE55528.1 serine/threonine-protein phosphatase [Streptomyces sp. NBC_01620]
MNARQEIERAVRAAPPYALVETVREALRREYGALRVQLLLADYAMTVLKPVQPADGPGDPLSMHNSPEGRAFGSQEPREQPLRHDDALDHHIPVTVRGERLGILTVRLPAESSTPGTVDELTLVADLLGHEILVAERDTDLYQRARRVSRLTLAAEMQWQLLPARACTAAEYAIGAQLEPAYAIHGDNFDWSADAGELTVAVTNGMGEGIQASLLTNLAVNALRNARRAGIGIADQASLADQAIYGLHRGSAHVSTLLLHFDLATGRVGAVDAGSPQLWRLRGRTVARIGLEAELPLGMFEESHYSVQEFQVMPGDRLLLVSDGVYEAVSPLGEAYGERALARAILATRLLPAATVPRAVLRELAEYRGSETLDDALVMCIDWFGRQ